MVDLVGTDAVETYVALSYHSVDDGPTSLGRLAEVDT